MDVHLGILHPFLRTRFSWFLWKFFGICQGGCDQTMLRLGCMVKQLISFWHYGHASRSWSRINITYVEKQLFMYVITNLYKQIATFFKIYQFQCCNLCPDFGNCPGAAPSMPLYLEVGEGFRCFFFLGFWPVVPLEPNNRGRWPSKPTWMYFISMSPGLHLNSKRMSDSWEFDGFSTGVLGCVLVLRWDTISLPCWWMTVPFPKMPSSVFGKVLLRIRRCQRCGKIWLKAWGEILNLWHMNRPNGWFMGRCKSSSSWVFLRSPGWWWCTLSFTLFGYP